MDDLLEIYQKIKYLRESGVKMKEIADKTDMPASVLSSLYSSVLPIYIEACANGMPVEEALDDALSIVNNVSKKRLMGSIPALKLCLEDWKPDQNGLLDINPFLDMLNGEIRRSVREAGNYQGIYFSYSLSSSSDCLKVEPYLIVLSPGGESVRIGHLNACGVMHWGVGIFNSHQHLYILFNEKETPQLALYTIYLQLPLYDHPTMLKGLYLSLDYNRQPIARRILFMKHTDSTDLEEFRSLKGELLSVDHLPSELQAYYDYTCQEGDFIKTCSVPSPHLNESDLVKEKQILKL